MTDREHREIFDGEADDPMARELADIGPYMRHKARVEAERPTPDFIHSLWNRLVHGEKPEYPGDVNDRQQET